MQLEGGSAGGHGGAMGGQPKTAPIPWTIVSLPRDQRRAERAEWGQRAQDGTGFWGAWWPWADLEWPLVHLPLWLPDLWPRVCGLKRGTVPAASATFPVNRCGNHTMTQAT